MTAFFHSLLDAHEHHNALRRLDERFKVVVALVTVLCVVASRQFLLPAIALFAAVGLAAAVGLRGRTIALRLAPAMAVGMVLVGVHAVFTGTLPVWHGTIAGWLPTVTRDGAEHGALLASKVVGGAGVLLLLGAVTPPNEMFRALAWLRMPAIWVDLATLMYRYAFLLRDVTAAAAAAQRIRLGYVGYWRSLRSLGILSGTVLLRSMDQAIRTHDAMALRGARASRPHWPSAKRHIGLRILAGCSVPIALLALFEFGSR